MQKQNHIKKQPPLDDQENSNLFEKDQEEGFEACGAQGCVCQDLEMSDLTQQYSRLLFMSELLSESIEAVQNKIDLKLESNTYNPCFEDEMDCGDIDCDNPNCDSDDCVPF